MMNRTELHNVRNDFSVRHVYSLHEYDSRVTPKHKAHEIEVSHYEGCCYILIESVHEHATVDHHKKAKWLIDVVFSFGRRSDFKLSKDAHIHVMVSLETLANVAPDA